MNNKKKVVRLTESELLNIIAESVSQILKEIMMKTILMGGIQEKMMM